MTAREVAELQVLLEGIPLPAGKSDLIGYARTQGGQRFTHQLERLPEREFGSLDEVGEALYAVQPEPSDPQPLPHPESPEPPGGSGYTSTRSE